MIRSPAGFDGGDRIKRYLDYYQPSYGVMMLSAGQFSPALLFAAGEQGVWYDPSDFSTMFQDAAGTTPVTAVEQPVGRILDKSGRGNHATQSTTASRPVLSARVNQLTYSEQFDNAAWTKAISGDVTITANATTAPDGTSTADLAVPNAVSGFHAIRQAGSTPGGACTFSVYYKPNGYTKIGIREDYAVGQFASFDCSGSGSVLSKTAAATASITALANGWYYLTFNNTSTGANQGVAFYILSAGYAIGDPPAYIYTGDGTSGGYIWGADLRSSTAGATLPAYQRIAAATDYDTTGFPYYLKFDGTDDSMATGTITPGVDKAQVFAGVRKQSDAAFGMIVEGNTTGDGKLYLGNQTSGIYQFYSRGTADAYAAGVTAFSAPSSNVISGLGDISGPFATVRVNGVTRESVSSSQGTGNYAAQPLYIGSRAGSSLRFNGNIYSLIVRFGSNLDATTISNTETYVNGKTLAY